MKHVVVYIAAAAMALSGLQPSAFAQSKPKPSVVHAASANTGPDVASIFNAYPNGGPMLKKEIADLIVRNPELAADVANYVNHTKGLSELQRQAAEQGLAEALIRLKITGQSTDSTICDPPTLCVLVGLGALGVVIGVAASQKSNSTPVSPN